MESSFLDLSPAEFRRAIAKGLGRARIFVGSASLSFEHRTVLLEASLDEPFEFSLDREFAPWVCDLAEAGSLRGELTDVLVRTLSNWDGAGPANHDRVRAVLLELARRGEGRARDALYALVRRGLAADPPVTGWDEVVELDGVRAIDELARDLAAKPSLTRVLVRQSPESVKQELGEAACNHALSDEEREVLRRGLQADHDEAAAERDRAARARRRALVELLGGSDTPSRTELVRWAMQASPAEIAEVVEAVFAEDVPIERLRRSMRILVARPPTVWDPRFLAWTDHAEPEVRAGVLRVLGEFQHPAVRDLALERLRDGRHDEVTLRLLRHNYRRGDHPKLWAPLDTEDERGLPHAIADGVLGIFEHNRITELSPLVEVVYERTTCSLCRAEAVRLLVEAKMASPWLREECLHDMCPEIRVLVSG